MAVNQYTPIGARFERLTVIGESFRKENKQWYVKCRCDCGVERDILCKNLLKGHTKSCGCFNRERPRKGNLTHGKSNTPAWRSYYAMMTRCHNQNSQRFSSYGGRGIKVCERWRAGFEFFLADMGERPDGCSLDRVDVDGDYSPENCRWATLEQQSNNKRDTSYLEHAGRRMSIALWAKETGIDRGCIEVRLKLGWDISSALTIPAELGRNQYRKK